MHNLKQNLRNHFNYDMLLVGTFKTAQRELKPLSRNKIVKGSHTEIRGNEGADYLTKESANSNNIQFASEAILNSSFRTTYAYQRQK